ncbi:MAG: NAD(P)H-hydrate dehydratase [Dehalococcoidales bacterium]|nr:NAD(P)H-hydrate dehydratase [Dehalococcoidales bacterium]
MLKILTVEQMRQVEQDCGKVGLPTTMLMENAGKAVAEEVSRILGNINKQNILVLVGPGNNGGDGLVAARYLHDWGAKVSLYLFGQRTPDDPNLKLVRDRSLPSLEAMRDEKMEGLDNLLASADAVIDAIFGTGKSRPLDDIYVRVLNRVAEAKEKRPGLCIIALDLPSGLNADSGAVDPSCLYADNTITLGFPKPGLFNPPGMERTGKITVVDIGIPSYLAERATIELITEDWVRSVLPKRPLGANKGSFGKVLIVAGSINYIGAAYLACSGAMRVGAGLVTLATASSLQPILASKLTEVTYLPLPESSPGIIAPEAAKLIHRECGDYNVLVLGCGLGQSQSTTRFVKSTLFKLKSASLSLVLDADALNTLAKTQHWWQRLPDDAILTPHPGEMARLVGVTVDEIQSDRLGLAKKAAIEWLKTIVLKGAYTVIVSPQGQSRVSPLANPGLASAGTGDVLTGVIAGLVAQGLPLFDAAACGVYLHGKAGEIVRDKLGDAGMMATDLLPALPLVIKQLKGT